ncbi:hypothetical protein GGI12_000216 [Dipsacomyces acuminosporus]|nr:hypothetical protein GGI12_000216 [Dipsacomyces acuminosporus]
MKPSSARFIAWLAFVLALITPSTGAPSTGTPSSWSSRLLPRILGGSVASKGEYPFIVYLYNSVERTYCGGSILSDSWVVSAAHCIKKAKASDIDVYVGQYNYNLDKSKATGLAELHVHPQYNDATMVNDIALLRLSSKISGKNAKPIDIDTGSVGDGTSVRALGWGFTSSTGSSSSKDLKEGDMTTLSAAQCSKKDSKFTGNDGARICVAADTGTDTCPGDSGGPLIRKVNGKYMLLGITSFGTAGAGQQVTVNCGGSGMISLFTHVNYFMSYIKSTTGGFSSSNTSDSSSGDGSENAPGHKQDRHQQGNDSGAGKTLVTGSLTALGAAALALLF